MKENGFTPDFVRDVLGLDKHHHTMTENGVLSTSTVDQRRGSSLGTGLYRKEDLSIKAQSALDQLGIKSLSHLFFGSVSASSTDLDHDNAKELRRFLRLAKKHKDKKNFSRFVECGFERIREWTASQYKIEANQVLFSRSGTDAIAFLQTLFPSAARILPTESGSTMIDAYEGEHVCPMDLHGAETPLGNPVVDGYTTNTTIIPLRENRHGDTRKTEEIHEDIVHAIINAQHMGKSEIIVHLPFPPKTGLLQDRDNTLNFARKLKDNNKLKKLFHDRGIWISNEELPNIILVGDFAQTRDQLCHPQNSEELMSLFDIVMMTTSKSLTGVPFAGVTLMSKEIRNRLEDALENPTWINFFYPYLEHYLARGHLRPPLIDDDSFINGLPVDTALFGRLLSAAPLALQVSKISPRQPLENAIRFIKRAMIDSFAGERQLDVVDGLIYPYNIESAIKVNNIHATGTVLNLRIHGVDAIETRKLMMTEISDENIASDSHLAYALRLPFELGNIVAESSMGHDGKHDQILRIAISLQHCVDWDNKELQSSMTASIEALIAKLHYVVNMQKKRLQDANKSEQY